MTIKGQFVRQRQDGWGTNRGLGGGVQRLHLCVGHPHVTGRLQLCEQKKRSCEIKDYKKCTHTTLDCLSTAMSQHSNIFAMPKQPHQKMSANHNRRLIAMVISTNKRFDRLM